MITTHNKLGCKILHANDKPPPVLVEAGETRIMQVICNLLTNAISKVGIIIDNSKGTNARKERRAGEVSVSFTDNGTGIDPLIIDKIRN